MDIYDATIPAFRKALLQLDAWLVKGTEHAKARGFEPDTLLSYRLAPDQFSLVRQVQSACDVTKWAASKLAGKDGPSIPDEEKTMAEARARIATAVAYLDTFSRADFAGAEERLIQHSWMGGKSMKGSEYVTQYCLQNFFFHITTAYSILRHGGVQIGKLDFIGPVTLR